MPSHQSGSFDAALRGIDAWVNDGIVPGAGAVVWHRGIVAAEHYVGDARTGQAVDDGTLFGLASVSKPFTATAAAASIHRGDLELDAPLSVYVPEFSEVGERFQDEAVPQLEALRDRITIRHLLCHTSGLPENIGVRHLRMSDMPSLDEIIDVMTGAPVLSVPGEQLRYSNIGYGLLARAIERASDRPFFESLQEDVFAAFDIADVFARPSAARRERIAHTLDTAGAGTPSESYNSPYWQDLAIPWGGFYGTPRSVVTFAAAFLPGHERGLPQDVLRPMRKDQTGGVPGGVETAGVRWDHGAWGFGWEVKAGKTRHWTGTRTSHETYCHWGQAGTLVWADPQRELALAVFANRTVHSMWPLSPPRWAQLSDAVVEAVDDQR
jgi:CubicO group peptidase (beta-lactamase class C family)